MTTILNWKQKPLSHTSEIYHGNKVVGSIKENSMNQHANGLINGKKFIFRTSGFIKSNTLIVDGETDKIVGNITYNSWMTKARIKTPEGIAHWKYDNSFNTKWSLKDDNDLNITYSRSNGIIKTDHQNDLLLLTGLYISQYYRRITFLMLFVVFVPILVTIINLIINNS